MKIKLIETTRSVLLGMVLLLCLQVSALAQNKTAPKQIAAEGDTVWVVVNHVKPDKKAQYERFIFEIFWPGSQKLTPSAQRAFTHTRVLLPAAPEEDGTYTYIFLMDPLIAGEDYWIDSLLRKMYPRAQADDYFKMFQETLARNGEQYTMLQSKLWGSPKKK